MNQKETNKQIFERLKKIEEVIFSQDLKKSPILVFKKTKTLVESCIDELSPGEALEKVQNKRLPKTRPAMSPKINFDMSERAFIKKYSKGMSGPKKFVLILVYLVRGEIGKEKSIVEIKNHWNKMISLLKKKGDKGGFNAYYSITAKDNNWVNSKKHGFFYLTDSWREIFFKK